MESRNGRTSAAGKLISAEEMSILREESMILRAEVLIAAEEISIFFRDMLIFDVEVLISRGEALNFFPEMSISEEEISIFSLNMLISGLSADGWQPENL